MSQLLAAYANMLEASVRTPKRFPGKRPSPEEADRRLRLVALLRALSPEETVALVRDKQVPDRLATLARTVGLPEEECRQSLSGIVWKFAEGLRPLPESDTAGKKTASERRE
jgi:hypothetical protein